LTTRQRWLAAVALVAIMAVAVYFRLGRGTPGIATAEAQRGEFIIDIRTKGELKALNSVAVGVPARVWGVRIVRMAPEGSMVKAGDFLIQFDTSQFTQEVEQRKNELLNAQAELESQRATAASTLAQLESAFKQQQYSYEQAKLRYEMMKYEAESKRREQELNLKKAELSLKQAEQKIASQKAIDEANIKKAGLKVQQAKLRLEEAQRRLEALTLKAPTDGLVVYKEIWGPSGREKVKVGDQPWSGQELVEIPDLTTMQVKTYVNEVDVQRVAVGQQVIITIDALPGLTVYGRVHRVATLARRLESSGSPWAAPSSGASEVKVFDVDVNIEGSDLGPAGGRPGMTAQCRIITDRIKEAIYVPLESVFEKEGKTIVYVVNGRPKRREVELGPKNSDYLVVQKGIQAGERVTLRDPTLPLEELGKEAPVMKEKKTPQTSPSGSRRRIIIG